MKQIGRNAQLEVVYKNRNGILFSVNTHESFAKDTQNIIYVNGSQLGHYNSKGALSNGLMSRTKWMRHYTFGSDCDFYDYEHRPYIFKYIVENKMDSVTLFYKSLITFLEKLSGPTILVGKSFGGVITSLASESSYVQKNVLVHPDIMGSPLSNVAFLEKYKKELQRYKEGFLWDSIMMACAYDNIMPDYAFTKDTAIGYPNFYNNGKTVVFGDFVKRETPIRDLADFMQKKCAETILRMTGKTSDGVVIFEPNYFENLKIPLYSTGVTPYHSQTQDTETMQYVFKKEILSPRKK